MKTMEMRLQNTCRQLYWTTNLPHVQPEEEQKAEEGALLLSRVLHVDEDMLDNCYHTELNTHYYMQTGKVIAADHTLPSFDWSEYHATRENDGYAARRMWESHEEKKLAFFLSVAEELWDMPSFAMRYKEFLSKEEIEAYHEYCRKIFIEERIFLQPEWLLFSCPQWRGKEEFLNENPQVDFFIRAHGEGIRFLPLYVWQGKALKRLLSKKYRIKN